MAHMNSLSSSPTGVPDIIFQSTSFYIHVSQDNVYRLRIRHAMCRYVGSCSTCSGFYARSRRLYSRFVHNAVCLVLTRYLSHLDAKSNLQRAAKTLYLKIDDVKYFSIVTSFRQCI